MQKTKLGISVGLFGAGIYLIGLFSGLLAAVILAGYVLLFEENEWLKICAVKAVVVLVFFSLIIAGINLIPDGLNFIEELIGIFGADVHLTAVERVFSAIVRAVMLVEKILVIGLGLKALNQGSISIPAIDQLIKK